MSPIQECIGAFLDKAHDKPIKLRFSLLIITENQYINNFCKINCYI
jgi:hypothetical protein